MISRILGFFKGAAQANKSGRAGRGNQSGAGKYSIEILYRGEQLRYSDEKGEVVVEICIPGQWIDARSLTAYKSGRKIEPEERAVILERIVQDFIDHDGGKRYRFIDAQGVLHDEA